MVTPRPTSHSFASMKHHCFDLQEDAKEKPRSEKDAVCYCTVGYRSAQSAKDLHKVGNFKEVYNLRGSILAWTHAGMPLEVINQVT